MQQMAGPDWLLLSTDAHNVLFSKDNSDTSVNEQLHNAVSKHSYIWFTCVLGLLTKAPTFLVNALRDSTRSEGETLLLPSPLCGRPSSSPLRTEIRHCYRRFQQVNTQTDILHLSLRSTNPSTWHLVWNRNAELKRCQERITCCQVCWERALLSVEHQLPEAEQEPTQPHPPSQLATPEEEEHGQSYSRAATNSCIIAL